MHRLRAQGGFLTQLAVGGVEDLLTDVVEETAGQGLHALVGTFGPFHEQDAQSVLAPGEDHQVDRHEYRRR
ncbi:hypothetical protein TPA0905_14100 [Streptomyces olivaceus]|nr:hypothetical protein TPA0905_14100 [Streptomyces olivaceus]